MSEVSIAEFARRVGVFPNAIQRAIKTGRISSYRRDGRAVLIDLEKAKAEFGANVNPRHTKGRKSKLSAPKDPTQKDPTPEVMPGGIPPLAVSEARRAHIRAAKELRDYKERTGELVNYLAVKSAFFGVTANVSHSLRNIPNRCYTSIAGRVRTILSEALDRIAGGEQITKADIQQLIAVATNDRHVLDILDREIDNSLTNLSWTPVETAVRSEKAK